MGVTYNADMLTLACAADFKNVSIVAHYIKERTRNAQFIIISLRNNMFELADRLVRFRSDRDVSDASIAESCASMPGIGPLLLSPLLHQCRCKS